MSSSDSPRSALLDLLSKIGRTGFAEHGGGYDASIGPRARLRRFYPAPAFLRALDRQVIVIVGGRGAGKTECFQVLKAGGLPALLELARERTPTDLIPTGGEELPERDECALCLGGASEARLRAFWLGQLARQSMEREGFSAPAAIASVLADDVPLTTWLPAVEDGIGDVLHALQAYDRHLRATGRQLYVAYDALDLLTPLLADALPAIRALLNLWLDRTYRWTRIRAKIFLRDDIFYSPLLEFTDASKLFAGHQTVLRWSVDQLYTLWINRVVNHRDWPRVERKLVAARGDEAGGSLFPTRKIAGFGKMVVDPVEQAQALLEMSAGYYMGTPRDEPVWEWIPAALSDANGGIAPRSLLVLVAEAAADALARRADPSPPWIRPEDLERGLVRASGQRFRELMEDAPWIESLIPALEGHVAAM